MLNKSFTFEMRDLDSTVTLRFSSEEAVLNEVIEYFADFLRGCGYVLPQDNIDQRLEDYISDTLENNV